MDPIKQPAYRIDHSSIPRFNKPDIAGPDTREPVDSVSYDLIPGEKTMDLSRVRADESQKKSKNRISSSLKSLMTKATTVAVTAASLFSALTPTAVLAQTPGPVPEAQNPETNIEHTMDQDAFGFYSGEATRTDSYVVDGQEQPGSAESKENKDEGRIGSIHLFDAWSDKDFRLIDNPQYSSKVGDYDLNIKYFDYDLGIKPRIRPKYSDGELSLGGRLYIQGELELMRTELRKSYQQGDWDISQGVRGSIKTQGRIGFEGSYGQDGGDFDYEPYRHIDSKLDVAGFKRWDRDLNEDMTLRLDLVGGVSQNLIYGNTVPYLRARQEIKGANLELVGQKFSWSMEAQQGISHDLKEGDTRLNYEVFAGLTKKFPMSVFGRDANVEVKLGPKVKGNQDKPFKVGPELKVRVRF